jgi:archaellum biogenesis protein FlaJ (TadC family)
LGHNQLNVLVFETSSINLLSIILVIILLVVARINSLALSVVVT